MAGLNYDDYFDIMKNLVKTGTGIDEATGIVADSMVRNGIATKTDAVNRLRADWGKLGPKGGEILKRGSACPLVVRKPSNVTHMVNGALPPGAVIIGQVISPADRMHHAFVRLVSGEYVSMIAGVMRTVGPWEWETEQPERKEEV